jgi:hypothetical protein
MGKADGHNEGYDKGYDNGYDRGFEAGVEYGKDISKEQKIDEQLGELEEADEPGCMCPACVSPVQYDAGYQDGYGNTDPCPLVKSDSYRAGYLDGQADSKKGTDWPS